MAIKNIAIKEIKVQINGTVYTRVIYTKQLENGEIRFSMAKNADKKYTYTTETEAIERYLCQYDEAKVL